MLINEKVIGKNGMMPQTKALVQICSHSDYD